MPEFVQSLRFRLRVLVLVAISPVLALSLLMAKPMGEGLALFLGLAGLLSLGIGWVASEWFVLRQVRALVVCAERLAQGDLSAPGRLAYKGGELGRLARAFEQMAQTLSERDRQGQSAQEALRELSGQLLGLQDEERRRLARELHDHAAQWLAALAMNLTSLESMAGPLSAKAQRLLRESLQLLGQCSLEVRTLCYLLHPPLLEELGLVGAIKEYTDEFAQRSGLQLQVQLPPELGQLPQAVESALFRVLQECLLNVHRHSGSATAQVRLSQGGQEVSLEVSDAGHGMEGGGPLEAGPYRRLGVGITGMRERLRQLGGRLEIASSSQGTTVRARVLLPAPTG